MIEKEEEEEEEGRENDKFETRVIYTQIEVPMKIVVLCYCVIESNQR